MENISFKEVIATAQRVSRQYAEHDAELWSEETKVADLLSHTGRIAQGVLETKGRKQAGEAADNLGQSMATVFFVLLDLANDLGVQFDIEFEKFLHQTQAQLENTKGAAI